MFNEAFYFFWLLNIVGNLSVIGGFAFFAGGLALLGFQIGVSVCSTSRDEYTEDSRSWREWHAWYSSWVGLRKIALAVFAFGCFSAIIPNQTSILAGGGQYVAEEAEVTETLQRVKTLVDQKLDDLIVEEYGTEEETNQ